MAKKGLVGQYAVFLWLAFSFGLVSLGLVIPGIIVLGVAGFNVAVVVLLLILFPIIFTVTLVFLIPGMVLRSRYIMIKDVAQFVGVYRRIGTADLASRLGKTEAETINLLAQAIQLGLLEGFIDKNSNEFFTREAILDALEKVSCPSCSAPVNQVVLKGEEIKCSYCSTTIPWNS